MRPTSSSKSPSPRTQTIALKTNHLPNSPLSPTPTQFTNSDDRRSPASHIGEVNRALAKIALCPDYLAHINARYTLLSVLGEGSFGVVLKAAEKHSGQIRAIKFVMYYKNKSVDVKKMESMVQKEIEALKRINSDHVLKIYDTIYFDRQGVAMVLECCDGGELKAFVDERFRRGNPITEDEAIYYLSQIMLGFSAMYKERISHRDFKLENILVRGEEIVIADFGFAAVDSCENRTVLGSKHTMAPEVIFNKKGDHYDDRLDLWSIGICFYYLLFKEYPFNYNTPNEKLKEQYLNHTGSNLRIPQGHWSRPVSACSIELLKRLIVYDPNHRIKWRDFFNHPIFDGFKRRAVANADFTSDSMVRVATRFEHYCHDLNLTAPLDRREIPMNDLSKTSRDQEYSFVSDFIGLAEVAGKAGLAQKYLRNKLDLARFCIHVSEKSSELSESKSPIEDQHKSAFLLMSTLLSFYSVGLMENLYKLLSSGGGIGSSIPGIEEYASSYLGPICKDSISKCLAPYSELFHYLNSRVYSENRQQAMKLQNLDKSSPHWEIQILNELYRALDIILLSTEYNQIKDSESRYKAKWVCVMAHIITSENTAYHITTPRGNVIIDWNRLGAMGMDRGIVGMEYDRMVKRMRR